MWMDWAVQERFWFQFESRFVNGCWERLLSDGSISKQEASMIYELEWETWIWGYGTGRWLVVFFKYFEFIPPISFLLSKFRYLNSPLFVWFNCSILVYSWEILKFRETSQFDWKASFAEIIINITIDLKEFYVFLV